ncbi:uncharacterized protein DS421_10g302000 [Arachis hypogaea]|nr:uncharacterized protein DS421_10g302000 [Arachis hypogaea]
MRSRTSTGLVKHAGSRSQPPLPSCRHSLDFMVCLQRKKKNNSSMAQTLAMPKAPSLALISNPRPLSRAVYFPVINPPKGPEQNSDKKVNKGLLMLLESDLPALEMDFMELQNFKWRALNGVEK